MLVIFKFQCSIIHNKTTREGRARREWKKHATHTPNAMCHHPSASTPSNSNRRIKPNAKNGTQKWNESWAFHENVPWRFIFMLSSIFDLIVDSFSIENWNENWNENWPKTLTVSIPNPSLGHVKTFSVPPPYTASSLKNCIIKCEDLLGDNVQLFEDGASNSAMNYSDALTLLSNTFPGSTEDQPIAMTYEVGTKNGEDQWIPRIRS